VARGPKPGRPAPWDGWVWSMCECRASARWPISRNGLSRGPVVVLRGCSGERVWDVEVRCGGWREGLNRPPPRPSGELVWSMCECRARARYPISGVGLSWGPVWVIRRGREEPEWDVEVRCGGWREGLNRPPPPLRRVGMDHVRVLDARAAPASSVVVLLEALTCWHRGVGAVWLNSRCSEATTVPNVGATCIS
jgi:hypothetical protein